MEPIFTLELFPKLDRMLLETLRSLSPDEWQKQTLAPRWKVHDVALHLLDGNIRTLSMLRDHYFGVAPEAINSYEDLVAYLNGLNADWITAMKRVSPIIVMELLESTGKQYNSFLESLDPFENAAFSVAWAGETTSANWFHIAREYTEKWHHQQQIRLAVGQEAALYSREFYFPYLDTSMRALPHHYRDVEGRNGDVIRFDIDGKGGGSWYLQWNGNSWVLTTQPTTEPLCRVSIPGAIAWRIFTKGISREEAEKLVRISGQRVLGEKILGMLAVMA